MKYLFLVFSIILNLSFFAQYPIEGYDLDNPTFLDSTLSNYNIIFCPEMHWVSKNIDRRKKMTKYLVKHKKIDVIVLERSYSFGCWINYFIETGDTLFLKDLFKDDYFSYKNGVKYVDYYGYYIWLRKYTIQNNHPIKIVGIDLDELWEGKEILKSFFKFIEFDNNLEETLKQSIIEANTLMKKEKITIGHIKKWIKNLEEVLTKEKVENAHMNNFVYNLNQSIRWAHGNPKNYRDEEIAKNFKRYTKLSENIFGPYGAGHTGLKHDVRTKHLREFGSILNEDIKYRGKILSIGLVSYNCQSIGNYSGDLYMYFTKDDITRLSSELRQLPSNTFVDLRKTDEKIKEFVQLLLIVHD